LSVCVLFEMGNCESGNGKCEMKTAVLENTALKNAGQNALLENVRMSTMESQNALYLFAVSLSVCICSLTVCQASCSLLPCALKLCIEAGLLYVTKHVPILKHLRWLMLLRAFFRAE